MEARLKAIMEMDASEVQKELVKTANELKKFERELAKTTDTKRIGELTSSISQLNSKMAQLAPAMSKAGNAVAQTGAAMNKSQVNAQNFARVIQDLPFGFMGIQNNLTQLVPGIGAAGLAFSALTAAITFSQVGLTYWTKKSKEAKAAADEFLQVTRDANKIAGEEIVKAKLLYDASNNLAIAMDKRIRAATELKNLYPEQFKNFTAEEIALGKAKAGYDKLTAAIVANARATAAKNKIGEIESEILNREDNLRKINAITKAQKEAAKTTTSGGTMGAMVDISSADSKRAQIEARRIAALKEEQKQIDILISKRKFYETFATLPELQKSVVPPASESKKATKAITEAAPKDSEMNRMIATSNDFQKKKGNWWRQTGTFGPDTNTDIAKITNDQLGPNQTLNQILAERASIQSGLNEQMTAANELAAMGGQAFGQLAMALMNGQNLGEVFADMLKRLVAQMVAAVAQAALLSILINSIPGLSAGFSAMGALGGGSGGGGMNLIGMLSGQNIQLSQSRTSTGMGYRRGR
jgi:hypothetical protein